MVAEISWMNRILKQVKHECDKVRSIQHILSRKKHAVIHDSNSVQNNAITNTKFGSTFTDHMLRVEYDQNKGGWQSPQITKLENIALHPAAKVLHYAASLFEGMKAYRGVDGKIRLFRPLLNLQRLNQSAERACLPKVDTHMLLKYIEKLVTVDKNYIPYTTDGSLYIRPTIIGTDSELGVAESKTALLYVILSPCGCYFSNGFEPVRLYADPAYTRAWPGGCGEYKISSNYAPTVYVQRKAWKLGCQQVLWLYGKDEQLTEAGTMSLFLFCINDKGERELITPPLEDGLILPSITRKSLLELSRSWDEFKVSERRFTMNEVISLKRENRLLEMFGAGTACIVTPIAEILYKGQIISVPTGNQNSPLYARFFKTLNDIQYGKVQHPWAIEVDLNVNNVDLKRERVSYA